MTIAAILILAVAIPAALFAAYKLLTTSIAQADEMAEAEAWLRDAAEDKGKTPMIPMPRQYVAALVRLLNALYWELQEAENQITQLQKGAAQAQPTAQTPALDGAPSGVPEV